MKPHNTPFLKLVKVWLGTMFVAFAPVLIVVAFDVQDPAVRGIAALGMAAFCILTFIMACVAIIGSVFPSRKAFLRQTENRCRKCGYDLRATPDRCPECGAIAPRRTE